jgi:Uma2 family endonuclease
MNQGSSTPGRMTAEEFYEWACLPENDEKNVELVEGRVIEWPRGGIRHGVVCGTLCYVLWEFTRRWKKGYACSNGAGVILQRNPDTVRGPDLALYGGKKSYEELLRDFWGETPPRLAVEVLWSDDPPDLVAEKVDDYLTHGVPLLWVIDTETRQATVYRPGKAPRVLSREEELTGEEILPGLRCRVADLFRLPGQEP